MAHLSWVLNSEENTLIPHIVLNGFSLPVDTEVQYFVEEDRAQTFASVVVDGTKITSSWSMIPIPDEGERIWGVAWHRTYASLEKAVEWYQRDKETKMVLN